MILTARDGRVSRLEQVYLRGSQIKYVVLPDALRSCGALIQVQKLSQRLRDKEFEAGVQRNTQNKNKNSKNTNKKPKLA